MRPGGFGRVATPAYTNRLKLRDLHRKMALAFVSMLENQPHRERPMACDLSGAMWSWTRTWFCWQALGVGGGPSKRNDCGGREEEGSG